jgi:hypothetical protein
MLLYSSRIRQFAEVKPSLDEHKSGMLANGERPRG